MNRNAVFIGLLALGFSAGLLNAQGGGQRPGGPGGAADRPAGAANASLLKGPAEWRFERMPTPPGFAPDIRLAGFEEARFAPGMFDPASPNYFTYVLVISADGSKELATADIKDFLQKYYRGLSVNVGRRKGLTPDPQQIDAEVAPMRSGSDAGNRYTAKVTFFDTFNDGRKTILNLEARVVPRPASKKTYLSFLISTQPRDAAVWGTLRAIEEQVDFGGR